MKKARGRGEDDSSRAARRSVAPSLAAETAFARLSHVTMSIFTWDIAFS